MRTITKMNLSHVVNHNDFTLALCAFLDEFKRSENRYEMIENPPPHKSANKKILCLLAAVSHKLANDYGLSVPNWVNDPMYKMPYPVFAFDTQNKEYQAFLLNDAPPEFASKNIFHSSRCIERV